MKQRVITGALFALLFLPAIYFGGIYFFCVSLIITFVSTYELMNMFYKKNENLKVLRYITPVLSSLFFVLLWYACKKDDSTLLISNEKLSYDLLTNTDFASIWGSFGFTFVIGLLFILVLALVSIFFKNPGRTALNTIFSFVYGGVMMSSALALEYMLPIETTRGVLFSGAMFAYLYTVVCFSDMFAYFTGFLFGKHKLCPSISPKKTIEGAIGGTLMAAIGGTGVAYLFGVMPIEKDLSSSLIILVVLFTFILSILVSIVSQFGDLFASVLKREYEIKDYGNILPGHGGILDRFDSTALAGSFCFCVLMLIKIICLIF